MAQIRCVGRKGGRVAQIDLPGLEQLQSNLSRQRISLGFTIFWGLGQVPLEHSEVQPVTSFMYHPSTRSRGSWLKQTNILGKNMVKTSSFFGVVGGVLDTQIKQWLNKEKPI